MISSLLCRRRHVRHFSCCHRNGQLSLRRCRSSGYEPTYTKAEYQPHDTGLIPFPLLPQQHTKTAIIVIDPNRGASACGFQQHVASKVFFSHLTHSPTTVRQLDVTMTSGPDGQFFSFSWLPSRTKPTPHQHRIQMGGRPFYLPHSQPGQAGARAPTTIPAATQAAPTASDLLRPFPRAMPYPPLNQLG